MGINDLKELVDSGEPVTQEDIAKAEAEHAENAYAARNTRAEVEQDYAESLEETEAKYAKAIALAEERRDNALAKNLKKRTTALEKVGLNPNGSDPQGREQGVL